jgi:hypothetical protein
MEEKPQQLSAGSDTQTGVLMGVTPGWLNLEKGNL